MDRRLASLPDADRGSQGSHRVTREEAIAIVALVLLGALLRTLRWEQNAVLFNDGPLFIELARVLQAGDLRLALAHPYHPLYSALMAWLAPLTGDLERAGATLSILGGSAAIFALWAFLRPAFGARAACIGAFLLAVHPRAIEYSGDVQSDGVYLAFFLGAVACLWRALERGGAGAAALAGALAGLAYLTRPEGLGLVLVGLGLGALRVLAREWSLSRATRFGVAIALGVAFVSSPYLLALRVQSGEWLISQKKTIRHLTGLEEYRGPVVSKPAAPKGAAAAERGSSGEGASAAGSARSREPLAPWVEPSLGDRRAGSHGSKAVETGALARLAGELREFLKTVSSALRRATLVFLALGCFAARGRLGPRGRFVLAIVGGYAVLLLAHQLNVGYLSRRHVLPPLVVAFGYAALGVEEIGRLAVWGLARLRIRASPALASAALLGSVAVLSGAKAVRLERADALAERRAAEWVRARDAFPGLVAAARGRVAYYAGARFVALPGRLHPGTFDEMRRLGVRYVILDDAKRARYAGFAEAEPAQLRRVHRAEAAGRSASVYEVAPRQASSRGAQPPTPSEG